MASWGGCRHHFHRADERAEAQRTEHDIRGPGAAEAGFRLGLLRPKPARAACSHGSPASGEAAGGGCSVDQRTGLSPHAGAEG